MSSGNIKLEAARELLEATKRSLQLVDEQIVLLQRGREGLVLADDVSSEHKTSWLGAVDDADGLNGIRVAEADMSVGIQNPKYGTIRNQEDAAFICTNIFVSLARGRVTDGVYVPFLQFTETVEDTVNLGENISCMLRLSDGNSGRSLITGMSMGPKDLDRGAVSFSALSSFRNGLGANFKNKLFSEFTIPRAGVVRVEVMNVGEEAADEVIRACVSLFGYKVFGA